MTNVNNETTYFTIEEALEDILGALLNGYNSYLCDLHCEVFNVDYYITGTDEAKQALTQYGVFEAIEEVQEYEDHNFGEVFTDLGNPEKVASMLYYLKGYEAMEQIQAENDLWDKHWNDELSDSVRTSLIATIRGLLELYKPLLQDLEVLVKKEESLSDDEELTDEESNLYVQIVDILDNNNIEIPFDINI